MGEDELMFTRYELGILREALITELELWEERIEQGMDVSEKFMATLTALELKVQHLIVEAE
jgi:hypothetical protein